MASLFKKTEVKLELLTDVDMLLMAEKGIRGGICHAKYRYANNKYMKNYNKDKEESFLQYIDDNSLCGWAMSQKLPVNGFKWKKDLSKFNEEFIKNYEDLPFLPERMKIGKCKKLVCNLYDKKKYVAHIRSLK